MFLPSYRSAYIYILYICIIKLWKNEFQKREQNCHQSVSGLTIRPVMSKSGVLQRHRMARLWPTCKRYTHTKMFFFFSSCLLQKIYNGSGWETDVMSPHDDVVSRSDRIIKTYSFHFEACFFYNYLEWIVSMIFQFIFKWNIRV